MSDALDRCSVDEGSVIVLMAQCEDKWEVQIFLNSQVKFIYERIQLDRKVEVLLYDDNALIHSYFPSQEGIVLLCVIYVFGRIAETCQ